MARTVAEQVGIDANDVVAEVVPQEKNAVERVGGQFADLEDRAGADEGDEVRDVQARGQCWAA